MSRPKRIALAQLAVAALLVTGAVASTTMKKHPPADRDEASETPLSLTSAGDIAPAPALAQSYAGAISDADTGVYTELEAMPPNTSEQDKFARAREAIAAAEAAGTRMVEPLEHPPLAFGEEAAAEKLLRRARMEPRQMSQRPGISVGDEESGQ